MDNLDEKLLNPLANVEAELRRLAVESGRGPAPLALSALATQLYTVRAALSGLYGAGQQLPKVA